MRLVHIGVENSLSRLALEVNGSLVRKFDTESFYDFSAKSSNLIRLFLFCIEADFCDQILILQHFSRSTRFAILCTAQIPKIQQILQNFCRFSNGSSGSIVRRSNFSTLTYLPAGLRCQAFNNTFRRTYSALRSLQSDSP